MPQRRKAAMKKGLFVLISSLVIVLLIITTIYVLREPKDHVPSERMGKTRTSEGLTRIDTKPEDNTLSRLFEEMGVVQMEPVAVPVEVTLPDLNGRQVSLSDFKGKILFVNFWATWCPPCREEMPSMQKLHARLKDKDFLIVAIDLQESAEPVKKFLNEYELTFMTLLDSKGETGPLFGINSIPTTLIMDKNGMIIGVAMGPRDWASKKSIALFEHLIAQEVELSS
jgi:thiol-disulfide isomerase/thioredoxin